MEKILIVDDEKNICDSLEFALEDQYEIYTTQNVNKAIDIVTSMDIDVVLLDMKIGEFNGLNVLREIKKNKADIQVIIITAFGSITTSITAIKEGAFHYITKPLDMEELNLYINKAIEFKKLNSSLDNLKQILNDRYNFKEIVGESKELKEVLFKVNKIVDIDTTVLITGESGTGKDLIAKALHFQGNRKNENFIVVNCAAIPSNLLESELFGFEKGAFTGADKKKIGKIQLAHNGTLFLDEIAEMDLQIQSKILRVVEDMKVTPLGSNNPIKVNLRIITATNKELEEEVKKGTFREDLFYRVNVINIHIPPLRERKGDILILLYHFLNKFNKKFNKEVNFTKDTVLCLERYNFPGNIRELENLVEMLVALSDDNIIKKEDIPEKYLKYDTINFNKNDLMIKIGTSLKEIEKAVIINTLDFLNGNRKLTADTLKISERNLLYKLKEYNTT